LLQVNHRHRARSKKIIEVFVTAAAMPQKPLKVSKTIKKASAANRHGKVPKMKKGTFTNSFFSSLELIVF
jgi:hypothetical protein